MEWIQLIIVLFLTGLLVGALARLILPGKEALGILDTALAGVAGSFLGGLVGGLLLGPLPWWAGMLFAVAGALLIIAPYSRFRARRTA